MANTRTQQFCNVCYVAVNVPHVQAQLQIAWHVDFLNTVLIYSFMEVSAFWIVLMDTGRIVLHLLVIYALEAVLYAQPQDWALAVSATMCQQLSTISK